jgi:hypothetical protein
MQVIEQTARPRSLFHHAVPGRRDDIPALTGLRFVAAFSILFMHTLEWTSPFNDASFVRLLAAAAGLIGMPLFFVLSGFVIHYNYGASFHEQPYATSLRNFFSARFARIYPLFLFFCIFGFISDDMLNWVKGYIPDLISCVTHSLTLTQSWIYEVLSSDHKLLLANGFGLSWSISCEFFFYIAYVFFVFLILPIKRPMSVIGAIVGYSAAIIFILFFAYSNSDYLMNVAQNHFDIHANEPDNSFFRWFFYYSPYVRIWEFILGCLTAQLLISMRRRPVAPKEAQLGAAGLYIGLFLLALYDTRYVMEIQDGSPHLVKFFALNFGCAVPLAMIIFCTARYESRIGDLLAHPWLVWLGEISFSIYAVHTWTLRPFIRPTTDFTLAAAVDAVFRVGFAISFTVIVASATYRIIEVPARRYLRRALMNRAVSPAGSLALADRPTN